MALEVKEADDRYTDPIDAKILVVQFTAIEKV